MKKAKELKEVKLDRVYTDGAKLYRGVGWLGKSCIVYEEVKPFVRYILHFGQQVSVKRIPGRKVKSMSLNAFSITMKVPTSELVDSILKQQETSNEIR